MHEDDDTTQDLALRATRGDSESLEALLVRYLPRLRAFLRSQIDAQHRLQESVSDLTQSTCRELLQAGPDFRWQGEARFRSWLFVTALNKIRGRLRSQRAQKRQHVRDPDVDPGTIADARASAPSPSAEAMGRELDELMHRALDRLSPDQREVIALARMAGLPIPEVAHVMGRSENAVRTLLSRALVALGSQLDRLQGHSRPSDPDDTPGPGAAT